MWLLFTFVIVTFFLKLFVLEENDSNTTIFQQSATTSSDSGFTSPTLCAPVLLPADISAEPGKFCYDFRGIFCYRIYDKECSLVRVLCTSAYANTQFKFCIELLVMW